MYILDLFSLTRASKRYSSNVPLLTFLDTVFPSLNIYARRQLERAARALHLREREAWAETRMEFNQARLMHTSTSLIP